MKKLFKYEINESIAAKAAMNCLHKRLFKEVYMGCSEPQEQEEGGMHNLAQVGHIMNTPSMNNALEPDFSDLEEQEAYNMNFRAIAELVADQIDRENLEAKGV